MTRTVNIAIVAALTVGAATVAAAVAGVTRAPRASEIPVMVTSRPATQTITPAAPPRTMAPAALGRLAPSRKPAEEGGSAHERPAGGRASSSADAPGKAPSGSGGAQSGNDDDRDGDVEVVKPPVHEEDESPDGYNPDDGETDSD